MHPVRHWPVSSTRSLAFLSSVRRLDGLLNVTWNPLAFGGGRGVTAPPSGRTSLLSLLKSSYQCDLIFSLLPLKAIKCVICWCISCEAAQCDSTERLSPALFSELTYDLWQRLLGAVVVWVAVMSQHECNVTKTRIALQKLNEIKWGKCPYVS